MSLVSPQVESFVLRFVRDVSEPDAAAHASAWRGVVVHVQSNTAVNFTAFADAVAFIAHYVPLGKTFFATEGTGNTEIK